MQKLANTNAHTQTHTHISPMRKTHAAAAITPTTDSKNHREHTLPATRNHLEKENRQETIQQRKGISDSRTSVGLLVSESKLNLTSGEASDRAPASSLRSFSFLDRPRSKRSPCVISSLELGSSIRVCASPYDRAARDRMTDLKNRRLMTSASELTSQTTEKVRRSTFSRNEHRSVPTQEGYLLFTRVSNFSSFFKKNQKRMRRRRRRGIKHTLR